MGFQMNSSLAGSEKSAKHAQRMKKTRMQISALVVGLPSCKKYLA
jgi:hypothetical protein